MVIKFMTVPTLLYGSEAWTMKRADFKKIQMSEMKFLRAVGGYNLLDKKRSEEIRKELLEKELNEQIQQYKIQWTQHVLRMSVSRLPKLALEYKLEGKRQLG
jgi:galactokinase/mevalonate kinase-like predicted kinase